ncbi:MAG: hypothetical protein ACREO4_11200 [Lysobacter sp.]
MSPFPRVNPRLRIALAIAVTIAAGAAAAQVTPKPATPAVSTGSATQPAATLRAEPVPPAVDSAFKAWDTDRDNVLSLTEFRNGWRTMNRGSRQTSGAGLRQQFDRLDANGNDGIDRIEYSNMVLLKRAGAMAPPFSEADRNRSQKLEFDEYSALVQRLRSTGGRSATPRTPTSKAGHP